MQPNHLENKITASIALIMSERPKFHGEKDQTNWQISVDISNWLAANVRSGMVTLETGAGSRDRKSDV